MTADAQAALRRVIEKYTSNTRFCMICNYVNKIIPALQSRCTRYVDSLCSSSPPLRWLSSQVLEQHEKIQSYLRIMLCSTTLATLNPNAAHRLLHDAVGHYSTRGIRLLLWSPLGSASCQHLLCLSLFISRCHIYSSSPLSSISYCCSTPLLTMVVLLCRFRFSPLKPEQIASRLDGIVAAERVEATAGGKDALMQLAAGDMRRVLNLLQSTHMAYGEVTEDNVYLTAGAAMPSVIQAIVHSLLNDSYQVAYEQLLKTVHEFGYALVDIVTEVTGVIAKKDLPQDAMAYVMDKLSNVEYRLSKGTSERLQMASFVGIFFVLREMMTV